jgi:hypothetical protein
MIEALLDALRADGREATHDQVADLVWLLPYILAGPPKRKPSKILDKGGAAGDQQKGSSTPLTDTRADHSQAQTAQPANDSKTAANSLAQHTPGHLFAPVATALLSGDRVPVIRIRVAAADSLFGKAAIARALRPLNRRFYSQTSFVLDEEATVDQIANGGPISPVLAPGMERWLDVALVVDESASMRVWHQTTRELAQVLVRQGAFRDVRSWFVNLDKGVKLYGEPGLGNTPRRLRHFKELIDSSGRRAILVVTDCIAPAWLDGSMFRVLEQWGRSGMVALVQMLPERMWVRTGLAGRTEILRASSAGAPNRLLKVQRPPHQAATLDDLKLPVITMTPDAVSGWARMVASLGNASVPGRALGRSEFALPELQRKKPADVAPEKRIALARAQMSPQALELAAYLTAAPLVMPVMRLVQAAMMSERLQTHLAEILLGGLVRQETPAGTPVSPDQILYDFWPGVRELLRSRVHNADKLVVLRTVSRLIEQRIGATVDWQALLADPTGQSKLFADPIAQKFAEIAPSLIREIGWVPPPPPLQRIGKRILVVGTALYQLPSPVIHAARAIGQALALAGFDLMSGGCQGVDYLVAEAYVHAVQTRLANVEQRFTQVVQQWRDPAFPGGWIERVNSDSEWTGRVTKSADAVLIVGGMKGAADTARVFMRLQKPAIPLPGTGDAARALWRELSEQPTEISDLLEALDIPVLTPSDAEFASVMAVAVLDVLFDAGQANKIDARTGLAALLNFLKSDNAAPGSLEVGWRWKPELARQVLKAWLQMPPTPQQAEAVLPVLPSLFSSQGAVTEWFQNQISATPEEWLASLNMLQLLPIARRYLEPEPPETYGPQETELRYRIGAVASAEGIASCLKSEDPATRVLSYFALQYRTASVVEFDLASCFALERLDARRWRETRPLRQLLVCVDRLGSDRSGLVTGQLDETRTFLYANGDLDPGRECRNFLESMLFRFANTGTPVTIGDLSLESSCWRAPQHDEKHHATVYRFDVVVTALDEILDRIHRVEYHLPPAWDDHGYNRAHQVIVNRRTRFKLKDLTYASDLDVHADVHFWGQSDPIHLLAEVKVPKKTQLLAKNNTDY